MKFKNEYEVQEHIHRWLLSKGYASQREVKCGKIGRCDIVTEMWAIEVKPFLTRSAIDNANAQVRAYADHLGKRPMIAGVIPDSKEKWNAAQVAIERAKLAGVSLIDADSLAVIYKHQLSTPATPAPQPVAIPQPAPRPPVRIVPMELPEPLPRLQPKSFPFSNKQLWGFFLASTSALVLLFNGKLWLANSQAEPVSVPVVPEVVDEPRCQPWEYCEMDK